MPQMLRNHMPLSGLLSTLEYFQHAPALLGRCFDTACNDEPHFGPVRPPQEQMMFINAALNSRTGLPVLRQHFMRVPRLALPHDHGSGRSNRNFEIRIFMVKGSVYYP